MENKHGNLITITSKYYMDYTLNMLVSLKKLGLENKINKKSIKKVKISDIPTNISPSLKLRMYIPINDLTKASIKKRKIRILLKI